MKAKQILSGTLAAAMVLSMAGCGGSSSSAPASSTAASKVDTSTVEVAETGDKDNGDGSFYNEALGYTYGTTFKSDEPITFTMFFNDNDAYPMLDTWKTEGVFAKITELTNVNLDLTVVNNASYMDKVSLAVSSGTAPYIIPKIYSEGAFVSGGGIVPVSDYTQYMPNFSNFYNDYKLSDDIDTIRQEDGKFYRLPGMKETALQDYTLLIREDIFTAAGVDVKAIEKDWTWPEFADVMVQVKKYMVEQGMCAENDYIWSDRWCGATSGYGSGGCLLNLISNSYGIYTSWGTSGKNFADLYFDRDADEFKVSGESQAYQDYMNVVKKLVDEKILNPETWTQEDTKGDNSFYTGKSVCILTNRATTTVQEDALKSQLGEGNYSVYRIVMPMGVDAAGNKITSQAENSRLECGIMISADALKSLGEDKFIEMMRFVDWLWYSAEGQTLTKWGVEGDTYTVTDGQYALTPGYYCGGLSIAKTDDSQEDMRLKYGYACGNFMYGGTADLLTSNFPADLQDFYARMGEYRTLKPLDPPIALSEDDTEMANLWGTPLFSEENSWTLKFAMGQADVNADWDTYVAALQAQNAQNLVDMYNDYYKKA